MPSAIGLAVLLSVLSAGPPALAIPMATHYQAQPASEKSSTGSPVLSASPPLDTTSSTVPPLTPDWMRCANLTGVATRFEVLPGTGWDNLNNKNGKGFIADMSYKTCQITADGQYLIPDNVVIVPLKKSEVQQYSDIVSDFTSYRSTTSQSMKLDFSYAAISASFSDEYQRNKANQVGSKSTTTRAQIRHHLYVAELKPEAALAPELKEKLLQIADLIHSNRPRAADYELQLIIRDYGPYVIKSVVAGGVFEQETQVKNTYAKTQTSYNQDMVAAASASFLGSVGFHFDYSVSQATMKDFQKYTTQSITRTYGGPNFAPGLNATDWEKGLANNLVAVDRQGDPIETMITTTVLPELPEPTVAQIARGLARASQEYMQRNTYRGCTDVDSPSFNYKANLGVASLCKPASNNYTFGGVFQNCTSTSAGLCDRFRLNQKNPLTGSYMCPPHYAAVLLHQGSHSGLVNQRRCSVQQYKCGSWPFKHHCHRTVCSMVMVSQTATYSTYWCVDLGKVPDQSGYLFGGVYSNKTANPMTNEMGCPEFYYPLVMGLDLKVCVSDDYERGFRYSVPFAGFFSCSQGNPLSLPKTAGDGATSLFQVGYGKMMGPATWPHHCLNGYAQHLATIDNGCEINYCVVGHAFNTPSPLLLQKPPYGKQRPVEDNDTILLTQLSSPSGKTWFNNGTTLTWEEYSVPLTPLAEMAEAIDTSTAMPHTASTSYVIHHSLPDSHSSATFIGLALGTAMCGILLIAVIVLFRQNRHLRRMSHTATDSSPLTAYQDIPSSGGVANEESQE